MTKAVLLTTGGTAVVLRVSRSLDGPRRVTAKRHTQFHLRSNHKTDPMSMQQLRPVSPAQQIFIEKATSFRDQRVQDLIKGELPIDMPRGRRGAWPQIGIIFSPMPLADSYYRVEVDSLFDHNGSWPPIFGCPTVNPTNRKLLFEGLASVNHRFNSTVDKVSIIHRNGRLEMYAVLGDLGSDESPTSIPEFLLTEQLETSIAKGLEYLRKRDVAGPVLVFVFMVETAGVRLKLPPEQMSASGNECSRKILDPAPVIFPEMPPDLGAAQAAAREELDPTIRQLCNAFQHIRQPRPRPAA
jgi:hypothetical protein